MKDENIILSREIFPNGRNICKIDGNMVTLSQLKEKGETLIDINGQQDSKLLLNTSMHIELLDKFIGEELQVLKDQYKDLLKEYKSIKNSLANNYGDEKDRAREIELLKYQINEIERANLRVGEEEELSTRRNLIMNSEKIVKSLSNAYYNLNDIVVDNLGIAVHEFSSIASLDEKYDKILLNLNEAFYMLKDSASETLDCISSVEFDEKEQQEIEERLDIIFDLKRKYGNDIESVLKYYNNISEDLCKLQNSNEIIAELKNKLNNVSEKLEDLAIKIRTLRISSSKTICEKVNKELQELEMKNAYIEFEFKEYNYFTDNGKDEVQILISTNVGEKLKQLSQIASGGEISRIMLALKNVFACVYEVPSIIFDEIDAGISGQAARMVGEKMSKISKTHQLICVTHLPVIAALGDENYFISKEVKEGKTFAHISKLSEQETLTEVARILDGNEITSTSLKHAKELRKLKVKS